jgi:zinc/manganese transport system permease protein
MPDSLKEPRLFERVQTMSDLIQILALPFLACCIMGAILSHLGIHVLKREIIFIDIAVAQIAAVGSIAAHLIFHAEQGALISYALSFSCVLLIAAFYATVRTRIVQISMEAVIGISYAVTAAAAMFLIGIQPGHAHAHEMLAGNLLWITSRHIFISLIVFIAAGVCFYLVRKPLADISEDYDAALARGAPVALWDFIFYAVVGAVITVAVRMSGVVVVFAFLVIPATTSALLFSRWVARMAVACAMTAVASASGLLFAYYLDFSIGPCVALFMGLILAVVAATVKLVGFGRIRVFE